MTATRAREAAVQMLLEDVEPLVQRTEAIAETLKILQAQLHEEADALAEMLRQGREAHHVQRELGQALTSAAGRIDLALRTAQRSARSATTRLPRSGWAIASPVLSALLATALTGLAGWSVGVDTIEQVQLGRAVQRAWPSLDLETRQRVQRAIGGG
jgi:chromosome segregation ATPase